LDFLICCLRIYSEVRLLPAPVLLTCWWTISWDYH
jgi:hypothetical protein